ncbi:MAG: hypothetical protein AB1584_18725 [Pseudomonadota bacterium]
MRRFLVLFLILLFPLNVLALSLSVSTVGASVPLPPQAAPFAADADASFSAVLDIDTTSDLDPDEPPAGMDLHDIVNIDAGRRLAALGGAATAPPEARRPCVAIPPPLRPPRAA